MSLAGKALGRRGETAAARYLEVCGYTLIERNYRTRHFEIDIIARQKDTLRFIEVKTRVSLSKGLPRESVGSEKQRKIIMGASHYVRANRITNQRIRFDVVEVVYPGGPSDTPEITLIRDAFQGI